MLARVHTILLDGLEPQSGWVEVDVRPGLPSFTVVGLPARASADLWLRTQAALMGQGYTLPRRRITIRTAPARLTAAPGTTAAIAIGTLATTGQTPTSPLATTAVVGDLAMLGRLDTVRGALQRTELVAASGREALLLPAGNLEEACCVPRLRLLAAPDLRGAVARLNAQVWDDRPPVLEPRPLPTPPLRLHEVPASPLVVRQLAWAVARRLSVLLIAPEGAGQTMLARAAVHALGPMDDQERLAVTRIHSAAGLHDGYGAMFDRPFRAPHHTTSPSGMLGTWTQPGEITLAHHGILYLDHAHQLHPDVLDELHAASRAGTMRVQQGHRARTMPAGALLIAAVPPCPCGQGESAYSCASRDHGAFEQHLHRLENRFDVTIRLPAYRHREA